LEQLTKGFELIATHPWMRAGGILCCALLCGFILNLIASRALLTWAAKTKTDLDDKIIERLHKPLVWSVILVGVIVASRELGVSAETRRGITRILGTIITILWFVFFLKMNKLLLIAARGHKTRFSYVQATTYPLFENLGKLLVFLGAVYAVIEVWNLDATGWLASAGVVGIAVGFAARDTLANLFAGVFIIADAPYRVGDFVVLGDQHRGVVRYIGLRSTRLLTRDDVEITVPNSVIAAGMIINQTRGVERMRCRVKIGVAYGSDIDQVRKVLCDVAKNEIMVCDQPVPQMRFRSFGDSSLDCELLCWIKSPEQLGIAMDKLNTGVYKALAEHGIEIPFPQRDLHVRSLPQ
jgi:MscS family membrane protein